MLKCYIFICDHQTNWLIKLTLVELGVNLILGPVRIAWETEKTGPNAEPCTAPKFTYIHSPVARLETKTMANIRSSKEQAVRIARFVSLYGIIPALMTIFNMSVSSSYGFRPHGSTGSFLLIYGVVIPFSIIVSNPKMRSFAKELIQRNTFCKMT